ncbi:MAG: rhodanese-related sulfurtransferase [Gemmobacter sp.]
MLTVAAFYRFARFPDPAALAPPLRALGRAQGLCGTVLLAREGINGTVAGRAPGIDALMAHLRGLPGCADIDAKRSHAPTPPFGRFKVRLKAEIVTMGIPDADPLQGTGTLVPPADWNALLADPDTVAIDTRNAFEVALGSFPCALDPGTGSFGDFPAWWQANRARLAGKRLAMFCTGGIRCEKATAWLVAQGVPGVHHLQGGILKYLEEVPPEQTLWQGECFVFDGRVALRPGLIPGTATTCAACRRPLTPADRTHPCYEEGAACHHCLHEYTDTDRARFRERHRQMTLAHARATRHLGG